ncbi:MAG: aromatic ring-hydroxylating dioxygenase subunit alpha [Pseudomonadota bacterium]
MTESISIVDLLQPGNGYRLPAEAYYSEDWYRREQRQLFRRTWNYIGDTADFPGTGSYRSLVLGGSPVVVVRGADGELRGFHNVCRHRGALLMDGSGTCETMTCPYHRWQYDLDGTLKNVPQRKAQLPAMDLNDWGLRPARLAEWRGLLFLNPDGAAPAFEDWLGDLPTLLNGYRPDTLSTLTSGHYDFAANWKFYIENHVDWYHLWYTHPETLRMWDHHAGEMLQTAQHWVSFEPTRADAGSFVPPLKAIPSLSSRERLNGAHLVFPNLTLFTGESYFATGWVEPLGPARARMHFRARVAPDQALDPSVAEDFLAAFRAITEHEDAAMTERLQATVESEAFSVGPMTMTHEAPIAHWHDAYLDTFSKVETHPSSASTK